MTDKKNKKVQGDKTKCTMDYLLQYLDEDIIHKEVGKGGHSYFGLALLVQTIMGNNRERIRFADAAGVQKPYKIKTNAFITRREILKDHVFEVTEECTEECEG